MNPKILKDYAKAMEDQEAFLKQTEYLDYKRSTVTFKDSLLRVQFKNGNSSDLYSVPEIKLTNEEQEKITETIYIVLLEKLKSNIDEAKKAYQQMLIEKL